MGPACKGGTERGDVDLLSVVLFTNRPGVWDIVLHSLAIQSSGRYELIVVDDARAERRDAARALARRLGVPLRHVVRSKRKTSAVTSRYGEANAINTGMALARGAAIALVNDYTWLPSNFVEETLAFFQRHPASLLAFPYDAYAPCRLSTTPDEEKKLAESGQGLACPNGGDVDPSQAFNASALSIFQRPLSTAPSSRGWFCFERNFVRERAHFTSESHASPDTHRHAEQMLAEAFWDGPVFAVSSKVAEALNGIDEILDVGNGFVNTDFARRAALLPLGRTRRGSLSEGWGVRGWVLPNVVVEHIESRRFGLVPPARHQHLSATQEKGPGAPLSGGSEPAPKPMSAAHKEGLWSRSYGNYPLYLLKMQMIAMGHYPLRAPNGFDLAAQRDRLVLRRNFCGNVPCAVNVCLGPLAVCSKEDSNEEKEGRNGEKTVGAGCEVEFFGGDARDLDPVDDAGHEGPEGLHDWAIYHRDEGRSLFAAYLSGAHLRAMQRRQSAPGRNESNGRGDWVEEDGLGGTRAGDKIDTRWRRWHGDVGRGQRQDKVTADRWGGSGGTVEVLLVDHCRAGRGGDGGAGVHEEGGGSEGAAAGASALVVHKVLGWDSERGVADGENGGERGRGQESSGGRGQSGSDVDAQAAAWRVVRALRPLCGESQAVSPRSPSLGARASGSTRSPAHTHALTFSCVDRYLRACMLL